LTDSSVGELAFLPAKRSFSLLENSTNYFTFDL